jgi:heme/copper-type cytochrome/quinol oxidase subunit 2/peroxiredoxin
VKVEDQVRAALELVALATRPDERGAYQRFLRRRDRHNRIQVVVGAVLLLVLLVGAVALPSRVRRPSVLAGGAGSPTAQLTVDATAFQWGWRFVYAGTGVRTTGGLGRTAELVVPVGQPIHVRLHSDDVVHSFSVPRLRFERQAIPDRVTEFDLTFAEAGTYPGRCGTYCGLAHTEMPFRIRAISREAFARWLREVVHAAAVPITLRGRLLTGGLWSSATARGRLVVLTVTASWCGPCHSSQGALNHVANVYQAKGVRFLAVAIQDARPRVLAFARTSPIAYPVLLDPTGTLAKRLQVSAVPATVILGRDGRIAARLDGQVGQETLSARLDALLAHRSADPRAP